MPRLKVTDWIEWTDDCQGKKDFDGRFVSLSTRYWPRGGGFSIFDPAQPGRGLRTNEDQSIAPHAHASIVLGEDYEHPLAEADFRGETFEEVKAQVERWAQEQFEKLLDRLPWTQAPKRRRL